jgi:tetratricopeptide (TPR) repeat protein
MARRLLPFLLWGTLTLSCGCTQRSGLLRNDATAEKEVVHSATTYESFANFRAGAGFSPDQTPQQQQEHRDAARSAYLKAIEVDPNHLPAYIGLARLQQGCEDFVQAVAAYDRALKLAPNEAALWHEMGLCQARQKNWAQSVASLQKASEMNPGNRTYALSLGYTLGSAGRYQESFAILAQVQGEAKAHYDMARLLRHRNQPAYARQHAMMAMSKDANLVGAKQLLAELDGPRLTGGQPEIQQATATMPISSPTTHVVNAAVPASGAPPTKQAQPVTEKEMRMPPLPVINIGGRK